MTSLGFICIVDTILCWSNLFLHNKLLPLTEVVHIHRVTMLNRGIMPAREREESYAILPDRSVQRHSVTSLETARSLANDPSWGGGGGWERSVYSESPGNCSVSYLSFVYGRSLWVELNGGENSLHWKASMLPLFSTITMFI